MALIDFGLRLTVLAATAAILMVGVAACGSAGGSTNTDRTAVVDADRGGVGGRAPGETQTPASVQAVRVARTTLRPRAGGPTRLCSLSLHP